MTCLLKWQGSATIPDTERKISIPATHGQILLGMFTVLYKQETIYHINPIFI